MSRKVKEIIGTAGLRDELTFTSFRHSDLTDAEMRAQGRHKSAKVLPRHAKRTRRRPEAGPSERKADRIHNEQQHAIQNEASDMNQAAEIIGASEGNRTLVISLEGCRKANVFNAYSDKADIFAQLSDLGNSVCQNAEAVAVQSGLRQRPGWSASAGLE